MNVWIVVFCVAWWFNFWKFVFWTDNKNKCNWYVEYAGTCQASWSQVENVILSNRYVQLFMNVCFTQDVAIGNRILLTSTSEVYGDPLVHPQNESYWGNVNPIGMF